MGNLAEVRGHYCCHLRHPIEWVCTVQLHLMESSWPGVIYLACCPLEALKCQIWVPVCFNLEPDPFSASPSTTPSFKSRCRCRPKTATRSRSSTSGRRRNRRRRSRRCRSRSRWRRRSRRRCRCSILPLFPTTSPPTRWTSTTDTSSASSHSRKVSGREFKEDRF